MWVHKVAKTYTHFRKFSSGVFGSYYTSFKSIPVLNLFSWQPEKWDSQQIFQADLLIWVQGNTVALSVSLPFSHGLSDSKGLLPLAEVSHAPLQGRVPALGLAWHWAGSIGAVASLVAYIAWNIQQVEGQILTPAEVRRDEAVPVWNRHRWRDDQWSV